MVKITIDITEEQDMQLSQLMANEGTTSKETFIADVFREWLEHMKRTM